MGLLGSVLAYKARSRKENVQRELIKAFAEKNPSLIRDLGVDKEMLTQISPNDLSTLAQIRQSWLESNNAQSEQDFYNQRQSTQPTLPIPQAPNIPQLAGSGQQAFEQYRSGQLNPMTSGGLPSNAPIDLKKRQAEKTVDANIELKKSAESAGIDLNKAIKTKQSKDLSEKFGETARVIQATRNLMGLGKAIDENPNIDTGAYAQIVSDVSNFRYTPEWLQKQAEPFQAYVAQMQEVKLGALPILSGQARYVVDLAKAIQQSIPRVGLIKSNRETLISQTVRNMMTLTYAIQNGFLSSENLVQMGINPNSAPSKEEANALLQAVKLTPEQEKKIEEAVDYVLQAPAIEKGKVKSKTEYEKYLEAIGK